MRRGGSRAIAAALVIAAVGVGDAIAGGTILNPPVDYPSDDGDSFRITKGDFDRDGHLDLAATNLETPIYTATVFLGKANGTLEDGVPFIGGGTNADIEAGRFGKDRNPDLALTDGGGAIEVFSGNGDGTFDDEGFDSYEVGPGVFGIDAGKLDGDRWTDLAAADSTGGAWVMLGRKTGAFSEPEHIDMGDADDDIIIADLNKDGRNDLATSDFVDQAVVVNGKPGGEFGQPRPFPVEEGPGSIAAADLNHDGRRDLAVSNRVSGNVAVLLAKAGGGYKAPIYKDITGNNLGHSRIAIADFDGDGDRDVAVGSQSGSLGTVILRGRGDGRLRAPQHQSAPSRGGIVVGSLREGDGPDVAVTSGDVEDGSVSVLLNK